MGIAALERPQYSDRQKAEALALLDTGMSLRAVEAQTGVPFDTVCRWRQGRGMNADVLELANANNSDLADKFEQVANLLVGSVIDMTREELAEAPVSQRMTGAGIAVDKMRLLRGETDDASSALADAIKARAMAELVKMGFAAGASASATGGMSASQSSDVSVSPGVIAATPGNAATLTTDVVIGGATHDGIDIDIGVKWVDGLVHSVDGVRASLIATNATGDATIDAHAAGDLATTLGTCQVCGERSADKVSRGGASVCSVCVP